jgi:hypothetical protein
MSQFGRRSAPSGLPPLSAMRLAGGASKGILGPSCGRHAHPREPGRKRGGGRERLATNHRPWLVSQARR